MSSAYHQYKRLGWRNKYESIQHKSYDNLHAPSYETLSSRSYGSMVSSRSYDTLPTKSYTSMRRKSYDTRYEADDTLSSRQNNPYELMRRRSFDNDLRYNPERRKSFTSQPSRVYESNTRIYMPERHYENGGLQSKNKSYETVESKKCGGLVQSESVASGLHRGDEKVQGENNDTVEVKSDVVEKIKDNGGSVQDQNNEIIPNKISEKNVVVVVPAEKTVTTPVQRKIKNFENMQNDGVEDSNVTRRRSFNVEKRYVEAERRKSYSVQSKSYDAEKKKSYESVQIDNNRNTEKEKQCTTTERVKSDETTTTKEKINGVEEKRSCDNGISPNQRPIIERQNNRRTTNKSACETERKYNNIRRSKSSDTVEFKSCDTERRKSVESGYLKSFDVELYPRTTTQTTIANTTATEGSFQRSKSVVYKSSFTELYTSYTTERYKTAVSDSTKIAHEKRYDDTKHSGVEKCSKTHANQNKSRHLVANEDTTNCFNQNTEHCTNGIHGGIEHNVNGTIMQNEKKEGIRANGAYDSDERKTYDKMDSKVNGNQETKICDIKVRKNYENEQKDVSLKNLNSIDVQKDNSYKSSEIKILNGVHSNGVYSNGVHSNGTSNGYHQNGEQKCNGTLSNGTKDIKELENKIFQTIRNCNGLENKDLNEVKSTNGMDNSNYKEVKNSNGLESRNSNETKNSNGLENKYFQDTKNSNGLENINFNEVKNSNGLENKYLQDIKSSNGMDNRSFNEVKNSNGLQNKNFQDLKYCNGLGNRSSKEINSSNGLVNKYYQDITNSNGNLNDIIKNSIGLKEDKNSQRNKNSNGLESRNFHAIQDRISETLKNLNPPDLKERKHSQTKSYEPNHHNNHDTKVYGKGQTKSYATAYRNQINRKRDRLMQHAEKVSDFEHNGLCLWIALQKIHQGFRKIFHLYFSREPASLYQQLSFHRVKLFQLQQRGLIEDTDWGLLFPDDTNTDSRTFDLILLSLLIRTVCEYREPKEGWWKVATAKEGIDTIHFTKIFSICTELSKFNFSINDGMFELLRKRLEKYMTMLYPPNEQVFNAEYNDNSYSEDFQQFSTAKERAKILEKKITRIEKLLKAIWWEVPPYSATYVHRNTGLDELFERRIKQNEFKQDINTSSIFALTGPPGIGKTEIARFWAHYYCQELDGNVIWIDSDNPNNIDTTFVKLAKRLGISLQDKFGKPVIVDGLHHHIYEQFSQRKSIFIFDNVKDDPTLQKIIPYSKQQYPIILITMQGIQTSRRGIISYELQTFSNEKALKLVEQIADHCDIRDTQKLAEKMNYLPFSLEIASHIINKRGITIIEFLKQFEKMKNENFEYDHDGSKLIRILVQMCLDGFEYDKLRTCVEDLLCVMALMDGNKIDMELLLHIDEYSKTEVKAALKEINAYSLVKRRNYRDLESKKCAFKMHPAIQTAIQRIKLEEFHSKNTFHLNGFFEMYHLRKVLDMVDRFREHENKLTPSYGELWAHHIICIIYTYRQSKAVMSKLEVFKHDIAIFNIQNRHYQSALYVLEIFRNFEVSLMVDNEDLLLDTEREYGNCFLMQGNFDAALSVFLKIHAKERDIFEDIQEPTLLTRFHIGICLQYLAISERQYTSGQDKNSDILKPRGTGAMFKREDEKISAALSVFQDVYTKANETLSGRHPLVVTAFHHIGICKYYQGDLSTALKIFLKVSEIVLDLDCEKQPNNLLMEDQFNRIDDLSISKVPSDLAAFEELYARQKDLLGETHPIALESKSQIAKCLQNVGNFLPALKHFSEIYEELKNLYGEEHPRSLTCREDIGNCLRKTKEFSAAFEIFKDVSKKRYCLLGENHPHTLDSQYETGLCLYYLNEFQAATSILNHVFERKKKILGELHASTLLTKQTYGICIRDSGDTTLASKVLQEVYDKYKIVYGENHPTTLGSRQQIGICYLRQLRFSTAYDILKEVSEKFLALFGKENLRTLTAEYHVSLCLMKLGKFMDALVLLRNICDNLDKLIGLEEPIYLNSAHHLGICLQAQGYLWTAINVFQEVYSLRRRNNKGSSSTLCSGHRLGMCCLDIGNHYAARYAFNELYHTLSNR